MVWTNEPSEALSSVTVLSARLVTQTWVPSEETSSGSLPTGMVCPNGVTEAEGAEGAPVPRSLVAVTMKVYGVPLVRPVTLQAVAREVVHVCASGLEVTV